MPHDISFNVHMSMCLFDLHALKQSFEHCVTNINALLQSLFHRKRPPLQRCRLSTSVILPFTPSRYTKPSSMFLKINVAAPAETAVKFQACSLNVRLCMQLCWPFNTLVQVGTKYGFDFQAEDMVLDALGWNVQNDTLTLFTTASLESAFPVVVVVSALSKSFIYFIHDMHPGSNVCHEDAEL